jgi:hypothetical protein
MWGTSVLQERKRTTMQDPPAGIPSRCIDHLADLVVSKVVANPAASFSARAGLTQQETLQGFLQGGESFLTSAPLAPVLAWE